MLPLQKLESLSARYAEIEELLWMDPAAPPPVPIAPLLLEQILPGVR